MTAQETQARAASEPNSIPEQRAPENILDPKSISSYGRLYLAATNGREVIDKILNPDLEIALPSGSLSEHYANEPREYNNITWGLSKNERNDAWKNIPGSFEDKKKKWNENLRASISVASDTRKIAIAHFTGKESGHTEDEINATLYNTFCDGKSNVSGFVKKALENPDIDFAEVEWLAVKLFGTESGKVVRKILELESSISTDEKATFDLLFLDPDKVNSPNEDEIKLLNKLKDGYIKLSDDEKKKIKATQPNAGGAPTKESSTEIGRIIEDSEEIRRFKLKPGMILTKAERKFFVRGYQEDPNTEGGYLVLIKSFSEDKPYREYFPAERLISDIENGTSEFKFDEIEGKKVKRLSDGKKLTIQTFYLDVKDNKEEFISLIDPEKIGTEEAKSDPTKIFVYSKPRRVFEASLGNEFDLIGETDNQSPVSESTDLPNTEASQTPIDLIQDVNIKLESSSRDYENFETSSNQLSDYLKLLNLPDGVGIADTPDVKIHDKKIEIGMNLTCDGETIKLTASLENDPLYGVRVIDHAIDIPDVVKNLNNSDPEELNNIASNIDRQIRSLLNQRINQAWEVSSFFVTPENFGINFRKKDNQIAKSAEVDDQSDQISTEKELGSVEDDDARREAKAAADDEERINRTAAEDEERRARAAADDEERLKRHANSDSDASSQSNPEPPEPVTPNSEPLTPEPAPPPTTEANPTIDDFDTVSAPDYDWGAALIAAREVDPGNNIYRQGHKFIREVVEPLIQGDIIPEDIKRKKDYSNLRRLQYDAAKDPENGVPLPTSDSLTS